MLLGDLAHPCAFIALFGEQPLGIEREQVDAPRPRGNGAGAVVGAILGGILGHQVGSGTGKTVAYLVPAIAAGKRVVISTGTKNLQDQLVEKDIPLVAEALGRDVNVALMKGRGNYLCRLRFASFQTSGQFHKMDEIPLFRIVEEWSKETVVGDRAEIDGFRQARAGRDAADAWHYLERAHILSQQVLRLHLHTHAVMLAFALSFDEVIVTTFTAGQQATLPIWMLEELIRPRQRPVTNVVAVVIIALTFVPILVAYSLTRSDEPGHR